MDVHVKKKPRTRLSYGSTELRWHNTPGQSTTFPISLFVNESGQLVRHDFYKRILRVFETFKVSIRLTEYAVYTLQASCHPIYFDILFPRTIFFAVNYYTKAWPLTGGKSYYGYFSRTSFFRLVNRLNTKRYE